MPELPDLVIYIEALTDRAAGKPIRKIRLASPFLLRSVDPPIAAAEGRRVSRVRRLGKCIVMELEGDLFLILHLMIAGRLRWKAPGAGVPGKIGLAAIDFPSGSLLITEASSKKRAWMRLAAGPGALAEHDRGGVEPLEADLTAFGDRLVLENRTLKRALTDPRLFSGIGNAYSDEILHRARLSPLRLTRQLGPEQIARLYRATRQTLVDWIDRLRLETAGRFPEKVTAFREGMAVHGRYKEPCPECGTPVQRIVYAENECNYCPGCQTGGRLLADRVLSRLLKDDWPKNIDDLEP